MLTGDASRAAAPVHVVVLGVAGSGKTTVAKALAGALGADFIEADGYHSQANVAKMEAGIPLTDEDRGPWLAELAAATARADAKGRSTVLACSALRRAYRDVLRSGVPPSTTLMVELDAPQEELMRRMTGRSHFMPVSLLESQMSTLEPLEGERGLRVDARLAVPQIVAEVLAALID